MNKAKVLFFAADPHSVQTGNARLQLDAEVREIRKQVSTAPRRADLDFDTHWAARAGDLVQALSESRPRVVHFSGHCGKAGLVLVGTDASRGHGVNAEALAQLFSAYRGDIRVVVLNACLSLPQAEAIAEVVGCAIGTNSEISDAAAITFSSAFYRALAFGNSIQTAFDRALAALAVEHFEEKDCPRLVVRGVDARKVFVVEAKRRTTELAAVGALSAALVAWKIFGGDPPCAWAGVPKAPSAAAVVGLLGPLSPHQELNQAKAEYEAGHYVAAFTRFERLAKRRNYEAMGYVGDMLLHGFGTGADPDSGISLLRKAAGEDDPRAMTTLASAYEAGDGVARSRYWARHWYMKAADDKRWPEAMRRLGEFYREEKRDSTALRYLQDAAKAGSVEARIDAGQMYELGQATPPDMDMAVCLYRTAADVGSPRGMLIIAHLYRKGIGLSQDGGEAAKWYRRAAHRGSPEAMYALAEMYHAGEGVPRDSVQAARWLARAKGAARQQIRRR